MAIDNSLHDVMKYTYIRIKEYLENVQLTRDHSPVIVKHEALAELLERFDIEALEEQSKDIQALHAQLDAIKEINQQIIVDVREGGDAAILAAKVASGLDKVFESIDKITP